MKKKLITAVIALVVIAALATVYIVSKSNTDNTDDLADASETSTATALATETIIDEAPENLTSIEMLFRDDEYTISKKEDSSWVFDDMPEIPLSYDRTTALIDAFSALNSSDVFMDEETASGVDLFEYGLDNPYLTITGTFSGDSEKEEVFKIGSLTVDSKYYYCMHNDKKTIYLLTKSKVTTLNLSRMQIADSSLTFPEAGQLIYFALDRKNNTDFELVANTGILDTMQDAIVQNQDFSYLATKTPIYGNSVFSEYFKSFLFTNVQELAFNSIVAIKPEDYSEYGFDDPYLTIKVGTPNGIGAFVVGNSMDNDFYYAKLENRDVVYSIAKTSVDVIEKVSLFTFIDSYVTLVHIDSVDKMTIRRGDEYHEMTLNHYTIKAESEGKEDKREINPIIDGKSVDTDAFRDLYQSFISPRYDFAANTEYVAEGEPAVIIEYFTSDPDIGNVVDKYYPYNNSFYISEHNGVIMALVNRSTVDYIFTAIENTLNETDTVNE